MHGPDEFRFLNHSVSLSEGGWDDAALPKLWRYNLHYFDDLNAEDASARTQWHQQLIARWIVENPAASGSGWEPYPTSMRIVNWIKWALSGNCLSPDAVHSLAVQARWLSRRLEYHLLGNHLFLNAKALIFAGCFFDDKESRGWLQRGLKILEHEISEQVLPDGGQFELSPMYHALALEDLLDLLNAMHRAEVEAPAIWSDKVAAMRRWLAIMTHPDGEIAFFNDSAMGIAATPKELERYASRLGYPQLDPLVPGCHHLPDSGYIRVQNERAVILIDASRVGPDYLPGHSHADTLSFELSVDGRRVFVNSGTSVYGIGPERLRQRGTLAHNTVVVDNRDSSEVWSGFRVARRARIKDLSISCIKNEWIISCAHDGYKRLGGRAIHRRIWQSRSDRLVISDFVEGKHSTAKAVFHLHPAVLPKFAEDGCSCQLVAGGDPMLDVLISRGRAGLEDSSWHQEFGLSEASKMVVLDLVRGKGEVELVYA